jgi:hypothetical protein
MIYDDYDDPRDDQEYGDEDEDGQSDYTVCMKGTPPGHDVASVIWASSESEALSKAASQWGCKPTDCFIYVPF